MAHTTVHQNGRKSESSPTAAESYNSEESRRKLDEVEEAAKLLLEKLRKRSQNGK